jgi:phosphoserine aminotransferase
MKAYQSRKHVQYTAVFPVYASLLTLQWLKNLGGVAVIEKLNNAKAALLYAEIDRNVVKGIALQNATTVTRPRQRCNVEN